MRRRPAAAEAGVPLGQLLIDWLVRLPSGDRRSQQLWLDLWRLAHRALTRWHDPLVRYRVGAVELKLPLSHALPLQRKHAPQYGGNLGRLAGVVSAKYTGSVILDIGANVGDSAAIIRGHGVDRPILCIEGDDRFFAILAENARRLSAVETVKAMVGAETATVAARLERAKGNSRVVLGEANGVAVNLKSLADILVMAPGFRDFKLIKLDTEGLDVPIVLGNRSLIERASPVMFLEYSPSLFAEGRASHGELAGQLADMGYRHALVWDNSGDFLIGFDLEQRSILEDLTDFYSGRHGYRYADLALFAASDRDLYETMRAGEIGFFRRFRNYA
jgi:FkbM family methyltransferase